MLNEKQQDFLSWHIYQIYPRSFYDMSGDGIGDLLHLRHNHPALTVGGFMPVAPPDTNYCAFTRTHGNEQFLVVCNFETAQTLQIPNAYGKLVLSNYGLQEKTDNLYAPYEVAVFRRNLNG